ncbi:transposase [Flavobacterium sp. NG2]|uniref:transposase n=1 Tax=Flavobacterium sp. NG2 TaxID=3097547 RepID=UPI002A823D84|nr:transposase [Flavobacterium sp. NG2]WPR70584.1 transposase [Flavobacterium sp. NG2]
MTLFNYKYRIESNRLKNWDYSNEGIYFLTLVSLNRESIFGEIVNNEIVLNDLGKIIETEIHNSVRIRDKWIFHNWVIMPNHIHLLIEIKEEVLIENYFLNNTIDVDKEKDNAERHCSASLPVDVRDHDARGDFDNVKRHCSASLPEGESNGDRKEECISQPAEVKDCDTVQNCDRVERHCSASLFQVDERNRDVIGDCDGVERYCSASLHIDETNHITTDKRVHLPIIEPINSPKFSRKPKSISSFVGQFKSVTTKKMNILKATHKEIIWQSNYHDHIVRNFESFRTIFYYIKNNPKKWDEDSLKKAN